MRIKIGCRSNLDLENEDWPSEFPETPMVGDLISSDTERNGTCLQLEVVRRVWAKDWLGEQHIILELHIPKNRFSSLSDFYDWYIRLTENKGTSFKV